MIIDIYYNTKYMITYKLYNDITICFTNEKVNIYYKYENTKSYLFDTSHKPPIFFIL